MQPVKICLVYAQIRESMLKSEELNTRQQTYAAIRSLLAQLDDPFTRFLEPSRYAALKRGTAGSLTGVGLEVGFDMGAGTDSDLVVWLLPVPAICQQHLDIDVNP